MKTLKEFEYDLWTTEENSVKHYWTRIKATGEVSEVSHDVMKYLRSLEAKMRRKLKADQERGGSDLSLDESPNGTAGYWGADPNDMENNIIFKLQVEELRDTLTEPQLSIFDECIQGEKKPTHFAKEHGVSRQAVSKQIKHITKKAKKIF